MTDEQSSPKPEPPIIATARRLYEILQLHKAAGQRAYHETRAEWMANGGSDTDRNEAFIMRLNRLQEKYAGFPYPDGELLEAGPEMAELIALMFPKEAPASEEWKPCHRCGLTILPGDCVKINDEVYKHVQCYIDDKAEAERG